MVSRREKAYRTATVVRWHCSSGEAEAKVNCKEKTTKETEIDAVRPKRLKKLKICMVDRRFSLNRFQVGDQRDQHNRTKGGVRPRLKHGRERRDGMLMELTSRNIASMRYLRIIYIYVMYL